MAPKATQPASTPILSQREAFRCFVRLVMLIRPYWRRLLEGIGLGLIGGVFGLVTPYLAKTYIDRVYPAHDVPLMHMLVLAGLVLGLASSLMTGIRSYFTQILTTRLQRVVQLMYFNHLLHLPVPFFDAHRVGEIMSRPADLRSGLNTISSAFQTILVSGVYLLIVPPCLIALNWRLAMLAMAALPVTTIVSLKVSQTVRKYAKRVAEVNAELSAFQVESLTHIRTLKAMAAEPSVYRRAADQLAESMRLQARSGGIGALVGIVNGTIRLLNTALFTWFAWTLILRGELTLGGFVAFTAYLGYLTGPASSMAGLFTISQQMAVTLGRAFEYLDIVPEQAPASAYVEHPPVRDRVSGRIAFDQVNFGYTEDRPVLHDLSLALPRGSVTSIVGASGSGKSSLLRLIVRMNATSTGRVQIDGRDVRDFSLPDLRRQVGIIWQDVSVRRGTVWDNLTFGVEQPDVQRVREAVRICRLDEFIDALPAGFDTEVAEWGASLSGGQRQRLALASLLVRDPAVLLLDEATSQIDVETEDGLMHDLLAHVRGRTVVFVTHRIATAAMAERICVLAGGRLAGAGDHTELLDQCPAYRRMCVVAGLLPSEPATMSMGSLML